MECAATCSAHWSMRGLGCGSTFPLGMSGIRTSCAAWRNVRPMCCFWRRISLGTERFPEAELSELISCVGGTCPRNPASSDGRRNTCLQSTGRSLETQCLSGTLIQAQRYLVQLRLGIEGQVGFLGQILAQQVGVF